MLGATLLLAGGALAGLRPAARDATVARRLHRLHLRPARLGLARDELPDGLRHRPAPRRPARRCTRLAALRATRSQAILCHELAIAARRGRGGRLTWGAPNQVGTWTFLLLWAMRLSAKLNVFLGVPQPDRAVPARASALPRRASSRKRPMNLLFPVSVTRRRRSPPRCWSHAAVARRRQAASRRRASPSSPRCWRWPSLEHWFLVLPLPAAALWNWGLRSARRRSREPDAPGSSAVRRAVTGVRHASACRDALPSRRGQGRRA